MRLYSHLITTKDLHCYLTFTKQVFLKKSAFFLDFEKNAGFENEIAIFSKTAIFVITKKQII